MPGEWFYSHFIYGSNNRRSEWQGAVLMAQLGRLMTCVSRTCEPIFRRSSGCGRTPILGGAECSDTERDRSHSQRLSVLQYGKFLVIRASYQGPSDLKGRYARGNCDLLPLTSLISASTSLR